MPDLAFIHPLLVKNPLPADALHAAVRQVATAGALFDTRLRAVLARERGAGALAAAWQAAARPALYAGIDDVALFAERLGSALPQLCAPFSATDGGAGQSVAEALHALRLAAEAQAAAAMDASAALAGLARFIADASDEVLDAPGFEALQALRSAQRAMECAWQEVVCDLNALLGQAGRAAPGSTLMAARLDLARAGWDELAAHLRAPGDALGARTHPPALTSVSAFRTGGIKDGADAVAAVIALLDSLATGIAQLPSPGPASAPLVGHHIDAVRTLARAWPECLRPGVLASMAALKHFGEQLVELEAPRLQHALKRMRRDGGDEHAQAAQMVSDVGARLALLAQCFDRVAQDVGDYLSAMARASLDVDTDTAAVARRLQSGQSRAEALACLANRLRQPVRRGGPARRWVQALLARLLDRTGRSPTARLVMVAHELDRVRSAQAATMQDAASLQSLLPALSSYLSAIDRLDAGMGAVLAGASALRGQLAELYGALLANPASGATASTQLRSALADWRSIARLIGRLPPLPAGGAMTPAATVPTSRHG